MIFSLHLTFLPALRSVPQYSKNVYISEGEGINSFIYVFFCFFCDTSKTLSAMQIVFLRKTLWDPDKTYLYFFKNFKFALKMRKVIFLFTKQFFGNGLHIYISISCRGQRLLVPLIRIGYQYTLHHKNFKKFQKTEGFLKKMFSS